MSPSLLRPLLAVAVLIGLLSPCISRAAETAVIVDDGKPGTYLLTVNADGTVTVNPIRVVRPGPAPQPNPNPQPEPAPAPLTARAIAIKQAAEKVTGDANRPDTAKSLALLFREVAKLARDPNKVKDEPSLAAGLKESTDTVLRLRNASDQWKLVRDTLATHWTVVKARGGSLADYAELLDEAADGLEASAPQRSLDPIWRDLIMAIIQALLERFFPK